MLPAHRGRAVWALLLAGVLLLGSACDGDAGSPAALEPTESPTTVDEIDVSPEAPSWSGTRDLVLAAGSKVLTPLRCQPSAEAHLVCAVDGSTYSTEGWARPVTLVAAEAALDDGHTSWQTRLRFAPNDARDLKSARDGAVSTGAQLLVQDADGLVLAVMPPPEAVGRVLVWRELEKPDAWGLVRSVGAG